MGQRALVVIELPGGNDGLSTIVPHGDGRYQDLRPTVALGDADVVDFDSDYGLNSRLQPFADRLAVLTGVGASAGTMSHFDMLGRWWTGRPDGQQLGPGFFGRLTDELVASAGYGGVSVGGLLSPAMTSQAGSTIGLPNAMRVAPLAGAGPGAQELLRGAIHAMGSAAHEMAPRHQDALLELEEVDALLTGVPGSDAEAGAAPPAQFVADAEFAVRLLVADVGVRVIHLTAADGPVFDTHEGHRERHSAAFGSFAEGLRALTDGLEANGLQDRVLIATTSEFGRRVQENNGGLDHGAASVAMLLGPVVPGVHGEPLDLGDLDGAGNLRTTVEFDRYYAMLASWMGIEAGRVLGPGVEPLPGIIGR